MGCMEELRWDKNGLIPAIVQDAATGEVLMLAYMSRESLQHSLRTGETWFYSRSRQRLWHKGEESGNVQRIEDIFYDCDADALLVKVKQEGVACHTGHRSCFYRSLAHISQDDEAAHVLSHRPGTPGIGLILDELSRVLEQRKIDLPSGSYTARLFSAGLDRILKKVAEEAGEVVIAAKNDSRGELVYEIADLIYHLTVLMVEKNISWGHVASELAGRRR